jgi:hypothetical protein
MNPTEQIQTFVCDLRRIHHSKYKLRYLCQTKKLIEIENKVLFDLYM